MVSKKTGPPEDRDERPTEDCTLYHRSYQHKSVCAAAAFFFLSAHFFALLFLATHSFDPGILVTRWCWCRCPLHPAFIVVIVVFIVLVTSLWLSIWSHLVVSSFRVWCRVSRSSGSGSGSRGCFDDDDTTTEIVILSSPSFFRFLA